MADFGRDTVIRFIGGQIVFRVSGLEESITELENYVKRSSNLSRPFQVFQKYWFDAIDENFASGGDPVEWPALSPAYEKWKQSRFPGQPIMRRSDELYDSLTNRTSSTIWSVGARHIEFGTRVPHFIYHQEGRGNNPQRPVLVLPDSAADRLRQLIENYILTGRPE